MSAVGERCCAKWVKIRFCSLQAYDLCVITVNSASEPIFFKEKGGRLHARSRRQHQQAVKSASGCGLYQRRWGGLSMRRPNFRTSVVEAVADRDEGAPSNSSSLGPGNSAYAPLHVLSGIKRSQPSYHFRLQRDVDDTAKNR